MGESPPAPASGHAVARGPGSAAFEDQTLLDQMMQHVRHLVLGPRRSCRLSAGGSTARRPVRCSAGSLLRASVRRSAAVGRLPRDAMRPGAMSGDVRSADPSDRRTGTHPMTRVPARATVGSLVAVVMMVGMRTSSRGLGRRRARRRLVRSRPLWRRRACAIPPGDGCDGNGSTITTEDVPTRICGLSEASSYSSMMRRIPVRNSR